MGARTLDKAAAPVFAPAVHGRLVIVLSGVALLYEPDLQKLLHPSLYAATPAERTIFRRAGARRRACRVSGRQGGERDQEPRGLGGPRRLGQAYEVKLFGNDELMVGTLLLGLLGLVLLGLAISGIVLWWPGIRRMGRGFVFRRGKGAYAVNYALHKLAGMAAIPSC